MVLSLKNKLRMLCCCFVNLDLELLNSILIATFKVELLLSIIINIGTHLSAYDQRLVIKFNCL